MKKKIKRRRFNLVYLEDQEINTHFYSACLEMKDPLTNRKIRENGTFYVNSKSFFFEPTDENVPLYKFLFNNFMPNKTYNLPNAPIELIKCPKKMRYYPQGVLQFKTKKIFEIKVIYLLSSYS